MQRDFYVYALFRPDTGQPFYIGKGKGDRCYDHTRKPGRQSNRHKAAIIRNAHAAGLEVPVVKIAVGLTCDEALAAEVAFIAAVGRRPQGPLVNLTDGGDGFRGLDRTAEHRAKIGAAHRGKKVPDELRRKYALNLEKARAAFLATPRDRWIEAAAKSLEKKPPESRSAWQKAAWASRVANNPDAVERMRAFGQRYASAEKQAKAVAAAAARPAEERSEAARKANASRTPEQRVAATMKAWETRRARKAITDGPPCLHD